jgi:hypothetical protein
MPRGRSAREFVTASKKGPARVERTGPRARAAGRYGIDSAMFTSLHEFQVT